MTMHDTVVKMKDGKTYVGPIWEFRAADGYLTIPADETAPDKIYFRNMESCVTKSARVSAHPQRFTEDQDEIARARTDGWDGES
jgi:hypothetical protein